MKGLVEGPLSVGSLGPRSPLNPALLRARRQVYGSCMVADRKSEKYVSLFQPIAIGSFSSSTTEFLGDLGRRLSCHSGEDREGSFLFQRLSAAIQRFNSVLLL